jgi:hypothetical protein
MKFHFSILIISRDEDGHRNFSFLEIGWKNRVGALFGLASCPECGFSMDLFWTGLAVETLD